MYSSQTAQLRRCTAVCKDGRHCQGWARWADDQQRCASHSYAKRRSYAPGQPRAYSEKTSAPPCTCIAYAWPHRPGGGLCCWPDPPEYRLTTPASTHSSPRMRPKDRELVRWLERRWGR